MSYKYAKNITKITKKPLVANSFISPLAPVPPTAGTNSHVSPSTISEIIIEKFAYNASVLAEFQTIITDLKGIKTIPLIKQPVLGMACANGCNPASDDIKLLKEEILLTPSPVAMTATQCFSDLVNSNLSFMYNGADRGNLLDNQEFMTFWTELTIEFAMAELMRKAWFDNTSYAGGSVLLTPQASSNNSWVNPTDTYFSCLDGIWSQLEALALTPGANHTTITENAGLTYAAQNLAVDAAKNYLNGMLLQAPANLFTNPNASFLVTRSMYQNLWASATNVVNLSSGAITSNSQISVYDNVLYYGGIKVIVSDAWDYIIRTFFNDGTRFYNPHRALLLTSAEILMAYDISQFTELYDKPVYDAYRDVIFQRFRTNLAAKLGNKSLIVSAF